VLKRDGTGVSVGSDCYPTSGTWTSPYDGGKWTQASDLDIDHMVPLKNAWIVSFFSLFFSSFSRFFTIYFCVVDISPSTAFS
jgi:hypothetical protein